MLFRSAPNISDKTRNIIWYRVSVVGYDEIDAFNNIWKSWTGVTEPLDMMPEYHPFFEKDLEIIESEGLGQQVTYEDKYVDIRVRHGHGIPRRYGSMMNVRCTVDLKYIFTLTALLVDLSTIR